MNVSGGMPYGSSPDSVSLALHCFNELSYEFEPTIARLNRFVTQFVHEIVQGFA